MSGYPDREYENADNAAPPARLGNRGLLVLRALANAPDDMSTVEIAKACFTGPHAVTRPRWKALETLRRLSGAGLVEISGKRDRHGRGGAVFAWKITDAGRARLAEQSRPAWHAADMTEAGR